MSSISDTAIRKIDTPHEAAGREVVRVRGDHSLRSSGDALVAAVRDWLPRVLR